jgi:hypothetical protein
MPSDPAGSPVVSPPLGTSAGHDVVLSIGGLVGHVELRGAPRPFVDQVLARYGAFVMPALPDGRYDFSVRLDLQSPPPGARDGDAEAEAHPLAVVATERTIGLRRWDFALRLVAQGRGRRVSYRGRGRCEMNPFSVDCILRVLWATLLPRVGGMLVHSCGLRQAEVAVVFPGASGAGKTTLARKAADPDNVLSDELCVIRRGDDGWRVHGTPFWGDFARGGISMRSWPLRTLAFLAQAPRDTVAMTPIVSAEATFRLLGCFLSHVTDRASIARNVALAVQLASEVRSVEASLTKQVPPPAIFRKLTPHLGPEVTRKVPAANAREMISDFRALLRKRRSYAFQDRRPRPPGGKPRGAITVRSAIESELSPGDIGLYWRPGRTPEADTLVCRRIGLGVLRGPRLEVLGKVDLGAEASKERVKARPLPKRIGDLSAVFGSLVASLGPRTMRAAS